MIPLCFKVSIYCIYQYNLAYFHLIYMGDVAQGDLSLRYASFSVFADSALLFVLLLYGW